MFEPLVRFLLGDVSGVVGLGVVGRDPDPLTDFDL